MKLRQAIAFIEYKRTVILQLSSRFLFASEFVSILTRSLGISIADLSHEIASVLESA